jgi:hypothetical protein
VYPRDLGGAETFARKQGVRVASFKIHGRCDTPDACPRVKRPLIPFERNEYVNIENLESTLIGQIEDFHQAVPEQQLVLVLDSVGEQFERVSLEFPGICRLFSAWIDPSTLPLRESSDPVSFPSNSWTEASELAILYSLTHLCRLAVELRSMSREATPGIHPQADVSPRGSELSTPSDTNISTPMATGMSRSAQIWEQQREASVGNTEARGFSGIYNPPLPPPPSTEEEKSDGVSKQSISKAKTWSAIGTRTSGTIRSEPGRGEGSLADYIYRNWTLWRLTLPGADGRIEMYACLNDGLLLKLPPPPQLQLIINQRENELRRQGASHALRSETSAHQQPRSVHGEEYNSDRKENGTCRVCGKPHTLLQWREISGEWDVDRNEDGTCGLCDMPHSDDEWRELTHGVMDPARDRAEAGITETALAEASIEQMPAAMITPSQHEGDLSSASKEGVVVNESERRSNTRRLARLLRKLMKDHYKRETKDKEWTIPSKGLGVINHAV